MRFFRISIFAGLLFFVSTCFAPAKMPDPVSPSPSKGVPIYLYHRFGHEITDSMTVSVARFESQLKKFKEDHCPVIPLRQLGASLLKKTASLPPRSAVIPGDDG